MIEAKFYFLGENRMEKYRLNTNDIITIMHIVDDYVKKNPHTEREEKYPAILQAVADGMCWDDGIVTDGETTDYVHG